MKRSSAYLAMIMVSGLALPLGVAGTVDAGQSQPQLQRTDRTMHKVPNRTIHYSLQCRAQGTPVEFPNDVVVINSGVGTIATGTKIEWKMTQGNFSGVYTLSSPLAPKEGAFISSVLPGGVPAATPCTAKVVS